MLFIYGVFVLFFIVAQPGLIIHGDVKFPWNIQNFIESGRYLFSDHNWSISGLEVFGRWNSMTALSEIINFFGWGTDFLVKFLFIFTTFLSLFSFYFFAKWLSKEVIKTDENSYFLVLLSIFFTSNPWVLNQIQAWGYWIAYITTPIIIMLFYKYIESLKFKYIFSLTVLISIISVGPQYLIFTLLLLVLFFVIYILLVDTIIIRNKYLYIHILICLGIFILLSLPWLLTVFQIFHHGLPMTTGYGSWSDDITANMINEFWRNATILNIFTGYDQWVSWFNKDIALGIQKIFSFIPIILFIYSLILCKTHFSSSTNKKNKFFFIAIIIITIFFATLAYGPHVPGYVEFATWKPIASTIGFVFRATNKLSYFIFIGYAIVFLFTFTQANRNTKIIFTSGLILFFLTVPFIKTMFYYWEYYVPIAEPTYYKDLYSFLDSNETDKNTKVIWLAPYLSWWNKNELGWETSFIWNPKRNANHTPETSSSFSNVSWYHLTYKNWFALYDSIGGNGTSLASNMGKDYLSIANIKYLVYHNDIIGGEQAWSIAINALKTKTDLKFLKQFWPYIYLFENPYMKPIIYTDNKDDSVMINKINPTKYQFNLNLKDPWYLYFAQAFDPFWQLNINGEIIKPEKAFDFGLIKYRINKTGTINGEISYFPQKYYEMGLFISRPLLILSLIYILYVGIIQKRRLETEKQLTNTSL